MIDELEGCFDDDGLAVPVECLTLTARGASRPS
jgi:hypothetical protein